MMEILFYFQQHDEIVSKFMRKKNVIHFVIINLCVCNISYYYNI